MIPGVLRSSSIKHGSTVRAAGPTTMSGSRIACASRSLQNTTPSVERSSSRIVTTVAANAARRRVGEAPRLRAASAALLSQPLLGVVNHPSTHLHDHRADDPGEEPAHVSPVGDALPLA